VACSGACLGLAYLNLACSVVVAGFVAVACSAEAVAVAAVYLAADPHPRPVARLVSAAVAYLDFVEACFAVVVVAAVACPAARLFAAAAGFGYLFRRVFAGAAGLFSSCHSSPGFAG
jgi:hypothetical protein